MQSYLRLLPRNSTPTCISSRCDRLQRFPIAPGRREVSIYSLSAEYGVDSDGFSIAPGPLSQHVTDLVPTIVYGVLETYGLWALETATSQVLQRNEAA